MQEQLAAGYLNETDFLKAGEEILAILKTLPKLKPFSSLDIAAEKQRITELFTQENAAAIQDYFCRRSTVAQQDQGAISLGILPPEYEKTFFGKCETLCATVLQILRFYDSIPEDMRRAFTQLRQFVSRLTRQSTSMSSTCCPLRRRYSGKWHSPEHGIYRPPKAAEQPDSRDCPEDDL